MDKTDLILSQADIDILKDAISLLGAFEEATTEISAERYVCVSKVMPLAKSLQVHTAKSTSTRPLKLELIEQMRKRFSNMEGNHLLSVSTLLDPRFKKSGFFQPTGYNQVVKHLVGEIGSVVVEQSVQEPQATNDVNSAGLWATIDERVASARSTTSVTANSTAVVRTYLDQPNISRHDDPLSWWHKTGLIYAKLHPVVKRYFSVPAMSVPAERLFSKAGELVSAKRSNLKSKNVDMMLFLNKALH